jgi:enhancing lycopene biosynthesis protein 2
MQKPIAVVLSGCGALDGSEIQEATLTLLALDRAGQPYQCLAPNRSQTRVCNMLTGSPVAQTRNILEESARIARGQILDLAQANPEDYAALIFPGGYGAALNLSNFAEQSESYTVQPDVLAFAQPFVVAKKPLGFICIAPVLAPQLYGNQRIRLTIGRDPQVAERLMQRGVEHIECSATDCVVDKQHKIITTPAYMLAKSIQEVAKGIERLVEELVQLL